MPSYSPPKYQEARKLQEARERVDGRSTEHLVDRVAATLAASLNADYGAPSLLAAARAVVADMGLREEGGTEECGTDNTGHLW